MTREELEKKAKALGITFNDELSDDDLNKLIVAEETKIADKKTKDPEFLAKELLKVINQRDEAKKEKRLLKATVKELKDGMNDLVSADDMESLQDQIKELTKFKDDIAAAEKKKEEDELSEVELLKIRAKKAEDGLEQAKEDTKSEVVTQFQKQLDDLTEKLTSKDTQVEMLRKNGLESEVIKVASKHKAIEPSHIYKMLRNEFEFDTDLGKFTHIIKDTKGKPVDEKSVDEFVKEFLEDKENDYLVSSEANTKSMRTKETHSNITKKTNTTGEYDPNDPSIKDRAEEEGLSVESYIETKQIKDKKMAAIEAEKEKSNK